VIAILGFSFLGIFNVIIDWPKSLYFFVIVSLRKKNMTLIKSISGIRGTIGGKIDENLTPLDIVKFVTGYATYIQGLNQGSKLTIIVGRDARVSGQMVNSLVCGTLMGMGLNVIDLGLSTTPTVEVAVTSYKANGGIILTASHNPGQWNALKLLNADGEFLDADAGKKVLEIAESKHVDYCTVNDLGTYTIDTTFIEKHIQMVVNLPLVDTIAIKNANFKVAVDAVNSTGGIAIPMLLKALGVEQTIELYCEPNGIFPHNPEPLPEHLHELSKTVIENSAHVGFVVDPDVDRLAVVSENGEMFGEEYTLVAVADYVLDHTPGNTVSNMSSTRALRDVTESKGFSYSASAVGEVNVVKMMKDTQAVIGGEGNGGVIYPELHYGRDALVGIALFLTHLAKTGLKCSQLKASYPEYTISKNKITLSPNMKTEEILAKVQEKYKDQPNSTIDGVKIEFGKEWVHLRMSNTEPIIRIYSESQSAEKAEELAARIIEDIKGFS
jgi:phosphomannomutase